MNNDAFRNLVNDRSKSKTTKEIAREAVELEFEEKKRKRGRGGGENRGYSSNDDDSKHGSAASKRRGVASTHQDADGQNSGDGGDDEGTYWKQGRRVKKKAKGAKGAKGAEDSAGDKYRDRAKERREGKNLDYDSITTGIAVQDRDEGQTNSSTSKYNTEMTKFLGGDEAHTHLVKGLDKTLAEKVRREEMGGIATAPTKEAPDSTIRQNIESIDLDALIEENVETLKTSTDLMSSQMPIELLLLQIPRKVHSSLGRGLHKYVEQIYRKKIGHLDGIEKDSPPVVTARGSGMGNDISTAAQTILRSTLSFSAKADPRDRSNAWEMPRETIMSSAQHDGLHSRRNSASKANEIFPYSPIERGLRCKIKDVFEAAMKVQGDKEAQRHIKRRKSKKIKNSSNKANSSIGIEDNEETTVLPDPLSEDSDDDIFGGIGEYVPPKATVIR